MAKNKQRNVGLPVNHPLVVRVTHWVNVLAVGVMVFSGWQIYNAAPLFGFRFPVEFTLGGWLAGGLMWHFAAMWLLVLNGLVYVGYNLFSGRYRRRFWPVSVRGGLVESWEALRLRLEHGDLNRYNMIQRMFYLGVTMLIVGLVASGLVMWKPVQFPWLRVLMGDYEGARLVHFFCMALVMGFVVVHVVMVLLVPQALRAMTGWGRDDNGL